MRKVSILIFLLSILFYTYAASAEKLDISKIKDSNSFYYNDTSNSEWTYSMRADIKVSLEIDLSLRLIIWGNSNEIVSYPELRVFVSKNNERILAQEMTIQIDNNVFDITLKDLNIKNVIGSFCTITEESTVFIESLSNADKMKGVIRCQDSDISFEMNKKEIEPIRQFMLDLIDNHFMDYISTNELQNSKYYFNDTPIIVVSYSEAKDEKDSLMYKSLQNENKVEEYTISGMGIHITISTKYIVLTKDMDQNDRQLNRANTTVNEVNEYLKKNGYILYAYTEDEKRAITIRTRDTELPDTNRMSDSELEVASGIMSFSIDEFSGNGVSLVSEIYVNNGISYLKQLAAEVYVGENDVTSQLYDMYFLTINHNAIFITLYCDRSDENMNDGLEELHNILDTIWIEGISEPPIKQSLRTYVIEKGPFTIALDEEKYNIVMRDMLDDEPAVKNSGMSADSVNLYMVFNNAELIMFEKNDSLSKGRKTTIRVKDKKYYGVDFRVLFEDELEYIFEYFKNDLVSSGHVNEDSIDLVQIDGIPYIHYKWLDDTEERYATIINGDMIYIFITNESNSLTDDDSYLLKSVVESIVYPEVSPENYSLDYDSLDIETSNWNVYEITDLGIKIELPEYYDVFIKNNNEINSYTKNSSGLQNNDLFKSTNTYLYGFDEVDNCGLSIVSADSEMDDTDKLNDDQVYMVAYMLTMLRKQLGFTINKVDYYDVGEIRFIRNEESISNGDNLVNRIHYFVVRNKRAYSFYFEKYTDDITYADRGMMEKIMDHVQIE